MKSKNLKRICKKIQCKPGIRYGNNKTTLNEAIKAHYATIDLVIELYGYHLDQRLKKGRFIT